MRFPYVHKITREAPSEDGMIHCLAAIQRHVNGVERFFIMFELRRPKQYPLLWHAPLPHHYPGLRCMAKLAPLNESPVESGAPVNARSVITAAFNNTDQSAVLRQRVTKYLRISTGVYKTMLLRYLSVQAGEHRQKVIDDFLDSLNTFWKQQADMASAFIRGEIADLTQYPIYVKIRPVRQQ